MGDGVSVEVVSPKSPGHGQFAGASLEIEELLTISSNYEAEGKIVRCPRCTQWVTMENGSTPKNFICNLCGWPVIPDVLPKMQKLTDVEDYLDTDGGAIRCPRCGKWVELDGVTPEHFVCDSRGWPVSDKVLTLDFVDVLHSLVGIKNIGWKSLQCFHCLSWSNFDNVNPAGLICDSCGWLLISSETLNELGSVDNDIFPYVWAGEDTLWCPYCGGLAPFNSDEGSYSCLSCEWGEWMIDVTVAKGKFRARA